MERRPSGCELVIIPRSVLTNFDQPGTSQVRQVPGDGGLGDLQNFDEVTDAQFAWVNDAEDTEANWVGKRPKHQIHLGLGRRGHIRLSELHLNRRNQVNDSGVNKPLDVCAEERIG